MTEYILAFDQFTNYKVRGTKTETCMSMIEGEKRLGRFIHPVRKLDRNQQWHQEHHRQESKSIHPPGMRDATTFRTPHLSSAS